MQEDEEEDVPQQADIPADSKAAAGEAMAAHDAAPQTLDSEKKTWGKLNKGAIFREVVLAKVREMKAEEEQKRVLESQSTMKK